MFKVIEEKPKTIIDGFEVEDIWDDEEPLFVSREDPVTMPDYSGKRPPIMVTFCLLLCLGDSALCGICKMQGKNSYFRDIVDAVLHVHSDHGVLGGSQILMLGMCLSLLSPGLSRPVILILLFLPSDADRMLKAGYLSLTAQVPDEEPAPAETVKSEEKETSEIERNQNIVGFLQSQVTPELQSNIQPNYLPPMPSQVAV